MDDDETLTAYHESGHAVVAFALGGRVEAMQLWGEADDYLPERFGDCRVSWGPIDPGTDWHRQREIMTLLAGPVAERIYRGEQQHPAAYGPWQHDWNSAMSIAQGIVPNPLQRFALLERIVKELHHHLEAEPFWPAIAELADQLAAHETLDREQVIRVLEFWMG